MKISSDLITRIVELAHMAGQQYADPIENEASYIAAKSYTQNLFEKLSNVAAGNEKKVSAGEATKECYDCKNKQSVPGNCHIHCNKPDPNMTGNQHGIDKGWFMYPVLFDPAWKTKMCVNFEKK